MDCCLSRLSPRPPGSTGELFDRTLGSEIFGKLFTSGPSQAHDQVNDFPQLGHEADDAQQPQDPQQAEDANQANDAHVFHEALRVVDASDGDGDLVNQLEGNE